MLLLGSATPMGSMGGGIAHPRLNHPQRNTGNECPPLSAESSGADRGGDTEWRRGPVPLSWLAMHQAPTPSRLRRTSPINYAALREQRKII